LKNVSTLVVSIDRKSRLRNRKKRTDAQGGLRVSRTLLDLRRRTYKEKEDSWANWQEPQTSPRYPNQDPYCPPRWPSLPHMRCSHSDRHLPEAKVDPVPLRLLLHCRCRSHCLAACIDVGLRAFLMLEGIHQRHYRPEHPSLGGGNHRILPSFEWVDYCLPRYLMLWSKGLLGPTFFPARLVAQSIVMAPP
jgi:hypothetical protein